MREAGNEPKCAFETSVYLMSHIIFSVSNLATQQPMIKQPSSWVGGSHTRKPAKNKVGIAFKTLTAQSKKSHHKHLSC